MHQEGLTQQLSSRAHGAPPGVSSLSDQNLYFHDIWTLHQQVLTELMVGALCLHPFILWFG